MRVGVIWSYHAGYSNNIYQKRAAVTCHRVFQWRSSGVERRSAGNLELQQKLQQKIQRVFLRTAFLEATRFPSPRNLKKIIMIMINKQITHAHADEISRITCNSDVRQREDCVYADRREGRQRRRRRRTGELLSRNSNFFEINKVKKKK